MQSCASEGSQSSSQNVEPITRSSSLRPPGSSSTASRGPMTTRAPPCVRPYTEAIGNRTSQTS
eukprot:6734171-Lingulodinium_polyedra.AAC.1